MSSFAPSAAAFLWRIEHWEELCCKNVVSKWLHEGQIHFALTMESAGKKVRDQGTQSLYSDSIDACDRVGHGGMILTHATGNF